MSQLGLTAASGAVFGPFDAIVDETPRYVGTLNGVQSIYPKTVVGAATIGAWQAPTVTPPPPPIPSSITNAQARYVMRRTAYATGTLLEAVDAAIRNSGDADLIDFWDYANEFNRSSPRVIALAAALALSSADLDQMFIAAEKVAL